MSKIFIPLPSDKSISLYLQQDFDGFFIGLEGFSSNFNSLVKLEDLESILDKIKGYDKKIFIAFDRLYYNDEIDKVREVLLTLKDMNVGILYTDIGVLNILNDIDFKGDILWFSNHLGTNSKTINFLEKRKVSYSLLSTEISVNEIINIKKKTNMKIGVTLYGYLNMTTSSRKLLTNYFLYTNKNKDKDIYTIKDKVKDNNYTLVEKENTNFFTGAVLNGITFFPKLLENNIDFIFLDDYLLNENNFYNVIEAFSSLRKAPNDKEFVDKLEKVVETNTFADTFYGFLDKETVYKVDDL